MTVRPRTMVLAALVATGVAAVGWASVPGKRAVGPPVMAVTVAPGTASEEVVTGFAAGGDRVVTVAHALAAGRLTVRGPGRVARAGRVLLVDRRADLAILSVPGLRAARVRLGRAAVAEARIRLRRPGGTDDQPARVRRRLVAHVRDASGAAVASRPALELAADVAAGDSGAPILDEHGQVTAVLFARSRERRRVAYAVDAEQLAALLRAAGPDKGSLPRLRGRGSHDREGA